MVKKLIEVRILTKNNYILIMDKMLEDERQKFKEKVLSANLTDQVMLLKKFVDENRSDLKTKKDKIIFLGERFLGESGFSSWVIANVVGCHRDYVRRLVTSWGEVREGATRERKLTPLIKQKVLERDNWQCIRCSAKKDLIVHHIVPYARIIYYKRGLEKASNLDNLATLCEKCHLVAHKGGLGNVVYHNTKADFWKWVLKSVPGIGRVKARSLYTAGYRTRRDLKEVSVDKLAEVLDVGLETAKKIKRRIVLATVR